MLNTKASRLPAPSEVSELLAGPHSNGGAALSRPQIDTLTSVVLRHPQADAETIDLQKFAAFNDDVVDNAVGLGLLSCEPAVAL
jgi:hypothetical protein